MPCPTSTVTADRGGVATWVGTPGTETALVRRNTCVTPSWSGCCWSSPAHTLSRLDAAPQSQSSAGQQSNAAERVDLNAADRPALEALPGIGPRTAELIIEYRNETGGFKKVEELVSSIETKGTVAGRRRAIQERRLCVERVTKRFGRRRVLRGASFQVSPGRTVGVIGANGSGKTTLLRIMLGLVRPDSGRVTPNGDYPADAFREFPVAYFGRGSALPAHARVSQWARLFTRTGPLLPIAGGYGRCHAGSGSWSVCKQGWSAESLSWLFSMSPGRASTLRDRSGWLGVLTIAGVEARWWCCRHIASPTLLVCVTRMPSCIAVVSPVSTEIVSDVQDNRWQTDSGLRIWL